MEWKVDLGRVSISISISTSKLAKLNLGINGHFEPHFSRLNSKRVGYICLPTYHHEWFSNGLIVK